MKKIFIICLLFAGLGAFSQDKTPATLRSILLAQFRSTSDQEDWFVPVMIAVNGVTAKQAAWKPADSCHSIGELAYHLLFWDKEQLDKITGNPPAAFSGNNNETFTGFSEANWGPIVTQLGQVLKDLETAFKTADDAKIQSMYDALAHISTHNAYHTGQIIYVRKLQGSWDASKGVK